MSRSFAGSTEFLRLLAGQAEPDLTRLALEFARDAYPLLDPAEYLDFIDAVAERVAVRCPAGSRIEQILPQVNWVLFVEERFAGNADDYYDARNSYLNQVIDRRLGIPISLSILYKAVAERLGVHLCGVNLPAHFVLRTIGDSPAIFIDPYNGGLRLDADGCRRRVEEVTGQPLDAAELSLDPCDAKTFVTRMLRNLKAVYLMQQDFSAAWPVQSRLTALFPDSSLEQRDLGLIALRSDRPGVAATMLASYLDAQPDASDAVAVRQYLRTARMELAAWN